jgi:hypothetical protein
MMRDKQTCSGFFLGFFSLFRFRSGSLTPMKYQDISNYVFSVEDDINKAFTKLKDEYERN